MATPAPDPAPEQFAMNDQAGDIIKRVNALELENKQLKKELSELRDGLESYFTVVDTWTYRHKFMWVNDGDEDATMQDLADDLREKLLPLAAKYINDVEILYQACRLHPDPTTCVVLYVQVRDMLNMHLVFAALRRVHPDLVDYTNDEKGDHAMIYDACDEIYDLKSRGYTHKTVIDWHDCDDDVAMERDEDVDL